MRRKNLINQPSVEAGLGAWTYVKDGTLNDFSASTGWSARGAKSAHLKITGTGANQRARIAMMLAAVKPGLAYSAAFDLNVLSKGAGGMHAFLDFRDASMNIVGSSFPSSVYVEGDNVAPNPNFAAEVPGAPWYNLWIWLPNSGFHLVDGGGDPYTARPNGPAPCDAFERLGTAGAYYLHYKATANGDAAHSGVTTAYSPVTPGETITTEMDVDIIQKPANGPAIYTIINFEPGYTGNPLLFNEQHGAVAPSTGSHTLTHTLTVPEGAQSASITLAHGGGGILPPTGQASLPNYQNNGEVTEFNIHECRITSDKDSDPRPKIENSIAPAGAAYALIQAGHLVNLANTEVFEAYFDGAMIEQATSCGDYADGDSDDWQWDGVPFASASRQVISPQLRSRRRTLTDDAQYLALTEATS